MRGFIRKKRMIWLCGLLGLGICLWMLPSERTQKVQAASNDTILYQGLPEGRTFQTGADGITLKNFSVNLGESFTLSAVLRTASASGIQVLFAKGPKLAGHYELWLNQGKLAFYAPDINGNSAIDTGIFVADGKTHHVAFTYNGEMWYAYLDGVMHAGGWTDGILQDSVSDFRLGSLVDGGFAYTGYLENVRLDRTALSAARIQALVPESAEPAEAYRPAERTASYTPQRFSPAQALRGIARLQEPAALPYIDLSATAGYEGSISKSGDNADWDWQLYQDQNGEWVLFEAYGPGCLYNFTQHRYPTSEEPTFYFYLDQSDTPTYEIRQSEFGKKAPFLSPLSGIYEGPEDGGRGPIWVVRSFVPMEFTSYCKVTSSVQLKGCDKAKGEGGWGHIDYVLYDTADGLKTFAPSHTDCEILLAKSENLTFDPKYAEKNEILKKQSVAVRPGEPTVVAAYAGEGSVASVKLILEGGNASPENLSRLRLRFYWDGAEHADVEAPIGTFFGNEYGYTACDHTLLMLGTEIAPGQYFKGYHYFPMPFWQSVRMELYTVGDETVTVSEIEIQITPADVCRYDRETAGYFVSSPYYEKTPNIAGENSRIAQMAGTGHMVYGVLSGYGIGSGCEGDVRVFFDGRKSPEMESDGSESWASYGWGFVTPPQSNPFSGYHGQWNSNSYWSEVRLTLGDSYFFKESLCFELEHGGSNEGMGSHSGQIFCYMLRGEARARITDTIVLEDDASLAAHQYGQTQGRYEIRTLRSAYENGINMKNAFTGTVHQYTASVSFQMALDPQNTGAVLQRTSWQQYGRQAARVFVDGVEVTERLWYTADSNPIYCWLDDSFQIPEAYTAGKDFITVTIEPIAADGEKTVWNAAGYRMLSITGLGRSGGSLNEPGESDDPEQTPKVPAPGKGTVPFYITAMILAVLLCAGFIGYRFKKGLRRKK